VALQSNFSPFWAPDEEKYLEKASYFLAEIGLLTGLLENVIEGF
jgi:hypothetical protein